MKLNYKTNNNKEQKNDQNNKRKSKKIKEIILNSKNLKAEMNSRQQP